LTAWCWAPTPHGGDVRLAARRNSLLFPRLIDYKVSKVDFALNTFDKLEATAENLFLFPKSEGQTCIVGDYSRLN
jgi:hypothetical protein